MGELWRGNVCPSQEHINLERNYNICTCLREMRSKVPNSNFKILIPFLHYNWFSSREKSYFAIYNCSEHKNIFSLKLKYENLISN